MKIKSAIFLCLLTILNFSAFSQDSYEPDNNKNEAKLIISGQQQTHSIVPADDQDWLSFTLSTSSDVFIETSGISGDTRLWLYQSDGTTQIEYDDDSGSGTFSYIDCNLNAGTYYIKMDEYGNNSEIAAYNISLTVTQRVLDSYEPDNSKNEAKLITSGQLQTHSIVPADDQDWLFFTLSKSSSVVIETSGTSGDTRMWLYQSDGTTQIEYNDDGSGTFSYIDYVLNAGTYYIKIDEYGNDNEIAAYNISLTVTPTVFETQKLTTNDGSAGDYFGYLVSVSGDAAIIGAYGDDDNGTDSGSAYIYEKVNGTWTQTAKIKASDGAAYDYFGYSVLISGDTAIIGAYGDDDNGSSSGSAYIFEKVGETWIQKARLLANDGSTDDHFAYSVSISGETAIIGAEYDDDNGTNSGSAYIFEKVNNSWTQKAKLKAGDGASNDRFGEGVLISGNTAIIGAIDADPKGSAYIFEKVNGTWEETQKLTDNDGDSGELFACSVWIDGDRVILGAHNDDSKGAAYIFEKENDTWTQMVKLMASDGADGDMFGHPVSISGDVAIIGSPYNDDNGTDSGSIYIVKKINGTWTQTAKLLASDGAASDYFSESVSISGNTAIVGAYYDDDKGSNSGSAYIFDIGIFQPPPPTTRLLSQDGAVLVGACADGSTEIIIEISKLPSGTTANNITFESLDPKDGEFVGSPQMYCTQSGIMARQYYKVPDKFDTGTNDNATRDVTITVSGLSSPLNGTIKLARPPLLLIHGLNSSADDCWGDFKKYLKDNTTHYQDGFYYAHNYKWTNKDSFYSNRNVFNKGYQYLKNQATAKGYAMTKVDVFGHSMGGILAKKYGDPDKIRSIITVGTPHFGSPIADTIVSCVENDSYISDKLEELGWDVNGGAMYDLQVGSPDSPICHVKADYLSNVSHTEINGIGALEPGWKVDVLYFFLGMLIKSYTKEEVRRDLFPEEELRNDWIVGELSQEGGCVGVDADVIWHCGEAADADVQQIALQKLENPPAFQPVSKKELELMNIENEKLQERLKELQKRVKFSTKAESLEITSPADGAQFNIGDTINVTVSATAGIQKVYIGCEIGGAVIDESAPFEFQFTPEATAFGQYYIVAIGRDSEGLVGEDSITINISPTADLSAITAYPEGTVILSKDVSSIELDIEGQYADAVNRNITSHITGTTYLSSDPSIVTVSEDGVVESSGVFGDATITVTNGTVTKDINVVVTKTSLGVYDWMLY